MNKVIPITFQARLFVLLSFGFIVAVVVGTLSHEWGHWLAGRFYGFKNIHIGYAYSSYGNSNEILRKEVTNEFRVITAAGPLQTMFAGTAGLLLLFLFGKRNNKREQLSIIQWVLVLLSLFWLREIFNLVFEFFRWQKSGLNITGDEIRLAESFCWPRLSIYSVASVISLAVLSIVIFRFIPLKQRLTFIAAGLTGGLAGAWLWLVALGPRLMP
jgi:hypothetical protein